MELHEDIDRVLALAQELADRGWENDNDRQMRAAERLYRLAEDHLTLGFPIRRADLSAALLMTDETVTKATDTQTTEETATDD